ncbi:MAG: hypothetical protein VX794_00830 [Nitrospinota bacterium]|nr:hypothetical protein [Nitrospinota bacterium]
MHDQMHGSDVVCITGSDVGAFKNAKKYNKIDYSTLYRGSIFDVGVCKSPIPSSNLGGASKEPLLKQHFQQICNSPNSHLTTGAGVMQFRLFCEIIFLIFHNFFRIYS